MMRIYAILSALSTYTAGLGSFSNIKGLKGMEGLRGGISPIEKLNNIKLGNIKAYGVTTGGVISFFDKDSNTGAGLPIGPISNLVSPLFETVGARADVLLRKKPTDQVANGYTVNIGSETLKVAIWGNSTSFYDQAGRFMDATELNKKIEQGVKTGNNNARILGKFIADQNNKLEGLVTSVAFFKIDSFGIAANISDKKYLNELRLQKENILAVAKQLSIKNNYERMRYAKETTTREISARYNEYLTQSDLDLHTLIGNLDEQSWAGLTKGQRDQMLSALQALAKKEIITVFVSSLDLSKPKLSAELGEVKRQLLKADKNIDRLDIYNANESIIQGLKYQTQCLSNMIDLTRKIGLGQSSRTADLMYEQAKFSSYVQYEQEARTAKEMVLNLSLSGTLATIASTIKEGMSAEDIDREITKLTGQLSSLNEKSFDYAETQNKIYSLEQAKAFSSSFEKPPPIKSPATGIDASQILADAYNDFRAVSTGRKFSRVLLNANEGIKTDALDRMDYFSQRSQLLSSSTELGGVNEKVFSLLATADRLLATDVLRQISKQMSDALFIPKKLNQETKDHMIASMDSANNYLAKLEAANVSKINLKIANDENRDGSTISPSQETAQRAYNKSQSEANYARDEFKISTVQVMNDLAHQRNYSGALFGKNLQANFLSKFDMALEDMKKAQEAHKKAIEDNDKGGNKTVIIDDNVEFRYSKSPTEVGHTTIDKLNAYVDAFLKTERILYATSNECLDTQLKTSKESWALAAPYQSNPKLDTLKQIVNESPEYSEIISYLKTGAGVDIGGSLPAVRKSSNMLFQGSISIPILNDIPDMQRIGPKPSPRQLPENQPEYDKLKGTDSKLREGDLPEMKPEPIKIDPFAVQKLEQRRTLDNQMQSIYSSTIDNIISWNNLNKSRNEYGGRNLSREQATQDVQEAISYMKSRGWLTDLDMASGNISADQEKALYAISQTMYRLPYLKNRRVEQGKAADPFAQFKSPEDFSKAVYNEKTGESKLSTIIAEKKANQEWYASSYENVSKKVEERRKQRSKEEETSL
ncbi:MAG: hypothetical protein NT051_05410 [Candidatus Micrarchaeota archaeon]|nr:hypothetical protein [Candidatus Micrarchaeota archaeon]